MQLQQIIFREMKEYDDQYIRPYNGNASEQDLIRLERDTNGGRDLNASAVAGVAGRIIRPVTDGYRAPISGGWGEQRLMFYMTVLVRETRHSRTVHEISGFTDYFGVDHGIRGTKLDENMLMYFNNVTRVTQSLTDTPRGNRWLTQINKSNQIISRQRNPDFSPVNSRQGSLTMRPEDIFSRNSTNQMFAERAKRAGSMDLRGGFNSGSMKLSNRLNTSSTRYFSRSMSALATANAGDGIIDDFQHDRDTTKIFKDARSQVREDALTSDPVIEELSQDTQIMQDGCITLRELIDLNTDYPWDDVPVYFIERGLRKSLRGDYRPWTGGDNETIAATILANALPMYLINHQVASISFTASNEGTLGEMVALPDEANPIANGPDVREVVPMLMRRLESELLQDMLPWDDCPVDVEVDTAIAGETYIKISLDGGPHEEYVFPTFADSMVSPILTEDSRDMDSMSQTISGIADRIGSGRRYDDDGEYSDGGIFLGAGKRNTGRSF